MSRPLIIERRASAGCFFFVHQLSHYPELNRWSHRITLIAPADKKEPEEIGATDENHSFRHLTDINMKMS